MIIGAQQLFSLFNTAVISVLQLFFLFNTVITTIHNNCVFSVNNITDSFFSQRMIICIPAICALLQEKRTVNRIPLQDGPSPDP